jgi:hypothetical protein
VLFSVRVGHETEDSLFGGMQHSRGSITRLPFLASCHVGCCRCLLPRPVCLCIIAATRRDKRRYKRQAESHRSGRIPGRGLHQSFTRPTAAIRLACGCGTAGSAGARTGSFDNRLNLRKVPSVLANSDRRSEMRRMSTLGIIRPVRIDSSAGRITKAAQPKSSAV